MTLIFWPRTRFGLTLLIVVAIVGLSIAPMKLAAQSLSQVTSGPLVSDFAYSEGAAWEDIDGDGDLDLFVSNILSQNNLLYLGDGFGGFVQDFDDPAVTNAGFSYGANLVDLSGDEVPDLFVANGGASQSAENFLFLGVGDGSFAAVLDDPIATEVRGSWSAATADIDNDGDLDVFCANYNQNNSLFLNDGSGSFVPVATGDIVTNAGASLGSAFADYDNDGDADLFVANADFGAGQNNFLYENNGNGTFARIVVGAVVTDGGNSVGGSWADYDNDGDLDLYVTNYFGEDNFLYANDGSGGLSRVFGVPPVTDGGSSVCGAWGDSDLDGDLDLFVSNDLNENNAFYVNLGDGSFEKQVSGDPIDDGGRSNGSTWADVDRDGDLDLFVTNGDNPVSQSNFFYRNDLSPTPSFLHVRLIGNTSNYSAIGGRVEVKATIDGDPRWQVREILSQTGYNSQNSLPAEVGLGDAGIVDSVVVRWPSGVVSVLQNVPLGFLEIPELDPSSVGSEPDAVPNPSMSMRTAGLRAYPNPFRAFAAAEFQLDHAAPIRLSIYDMQGRRMSTLVETFLPSGTHRTQWDGRDETGRLLPAGTYFLELSSPGSVQRRKVTRTP